MVERANNHHSSFSLQCIYDRSTDQLLFTIRENLHCHRCNTKGPLAPVFPALKPVQEAYPSYVRHVANIKPRNRQNIHSNHRNDRDASTSGAIPNQSVLRWMVNSRASDHTSPDFKHFLKYFPVVPEPVKFGNRATGYALGDISPRYNFELRAQILCTMLHVWKQ